MRGPHSVPASDQSALASPRAETTRMIVSSRARRAAVTAALNRIPTIASAVAAASRTSAAVRGLIAGQTAAAYWPAASANALGTMTNSASCRTRARKPARRPSRRATIPYRPPAVGYSAPSQLARRTVVLRRLALSLGIGRPSTRQKPPRRRSIHHPSQVAWSAGLIDPGSSGVRPVRVGGRRPLEQPDLAGVGDRLGPGGGLELAVDGLHLAPDGGDRDRQLSGD